MLLKCYIQYASKFGKLSSGHCWINSAQLGERQVMPNLRKTQRQNSKKDGTRGLKTLRVNSPADRFHIAFIELLLCKICIFFENMFPMFPVTSPVNVFLWTSMFFFFFSVQRAPDGWEQRSLQEHQRNNQCTHKQYSNLCWASVPKSAPLHLLKRSLWPQPISPLLWLIFVSVSCYFFSWFCKDIWQIFSHRPKDWKMSAFIPIPKKSNTEECSDYCIIVLISHASKVMLKILQVRLQQYVNWELSHVQAEFRKDRGTRDQITNIHGLIEKAREFQKIIYFCFIDYVKAFDYVDHNKLWKNSWRDGNTRPPYLPPEKSVCRSIRNC